MLKPAYIAISLLDEEPFTIYERVDVEDLKADNETPRSIILLLKCLCSQSDQLESQNMTFRHPLHRCPKVLSTVKTREGMIVPDSFLGKFHSLDKANHLIKILDYQKYNSRGEMSGTAIPRNRVPAHISLTLEHSRFSKGIFNNTPFAFGSFLKP